MEPQKLEEEVKFCGREGNVICHIQGNILLKENYLVPTESDTNLEIYLYFIKSNKLLSLIARRLAEFLGRGSCRLQLVLESSCGYGTCMEFRNAGLSSQQCHSLPRGKQLKLFVPQFSIQNQPLTLEVTTIFPK